MVGYRFDPQTQERQSPPAAVSIRGNSYTSSGKLKVSVKVGTQVYIVETTPEEWEAVCENVRQLVRGY
jgi:hypothetical protein